MPVPRVAEEYLLELLRTDADVAYHVGDRIYAVPAPPTVQLPCIVCERTETDDVQYQGGRTGLVQVTCQITVWSHSYDQAMLIAIAIRNAVAGRKKVTGASLAISADGPAMDVTVPEGSDVPLYAATVMTRMWYRE